jgi:hypothetical protein
VRPGRKPRAAIRAGPRTTREAKPWDMKELVIVDPDGNLLRAGQEI